MSEWPAGPSGLDTLRPGIALEVAPEAAVVPYRVRFDESTAAGTVRPSTLLRYAQDVAWIHSEALGFDRRWYAERGLAWLVRSAELEIHAPIAMGSTLLVRTAVTGFRKVWARRRTEVRLVGTARGSGSTDPGGLVAALHTDWVMTDGRGAIVRVPDDLPAIFGHPPGPFVPVKVELPPSPPDAVRDELRVRSHELDPMAHVNNAAYLDWAVEGVELAVRPAGATPDGSRETAVGMALAGARLEYLLPAAPGARLLRATWRLGDGAPGSARDRWAVRITTADGIEVVRAVLD